eukprot:Sdes_comp20984_c0_seq4m19448
MKLLVYYHIVAGFFLAPLIHPIPVCFFQDLDELSQGLQGRSLNPSAVLFDQLFHPNVDIDPSQPTRLCWIPSQPHSLPHLVVGKGSPGGAWASMRHSSLHSLSYASWMELPLYPFDEWYHKRHPETSANLRECRVSRDLFRDYYQSFVKDMGLCSHFLSHVEISSLLLCESEPDQRLGKWIAIGHSTAASFCGDFATHSAGLKNYKIYANHVILATGIDQPRKLGLLHEVSLPFVKHRIEQLHFADPLVPNPQPSPLTQPQSAADDPVLLVVGGGLSAVDAILLGLSHNVRILHIFMEDIFDPDYILNRLSKEIYPDYFSILEMMKLPVHISSPQEFTRHIQNKAHFYVPLPKYKLVAIKSDRICECIPHGWSKNPRGGFDRIQFSVDQIIILIGSTPNLSFLPEPILKTVLNPEYCYLSSMMDAFSHPPDSAPHEPSADAHSSSPSPNLRVLNLEPPRNAPLRVDSRTMETLSQADLYAVGTLVGDDFVRFIVGGCVVAAKSVFSKKNIVFEK